MPVSVNKEDLKSNLRGGRIKEVRRLQTVRDGTRMIMRAF